MWLVRLTGGRVPVYRQKLLRPSRSDYVNMMKFYAARYSLSGDRRVARALFQAARRLKHIAFRPHAASGAAEGQRTQ